MAVMNEAQTAAYIAEEKKYYTFEMSLGPVPRSPENVTLFYKAIIHLLKRPTCEILLTNHMSLSCIYKMKKSDFGDVDWSGGEWRNERRKLRILTGYYAGEKKETTARTRCHEICTRKFPYRGTHYRYKEAGLD